MILLIGLKAPTKGKQEQITEGVWNIFVASWELHMKFSQIWKEMYVQTIIFSIHLKISRVLPLLSIDLESKGK